jgi:hypothetical protein
MTHARNRSRRHDTGASGAGKLPFAPPEAFGRYRPFPEAPPGTVKRPDWPFPAFRKTARGLPGISSMPECGGQYE